MLSISFKNIVVGIIIGIFSIGVGSSCQQEQKFDDQLSSDELEIYNFLVAGKSNEIVVINTAMANVLGIDEAGDFEPILNEIKRDTSINYLKINKFPPKITKDLTLNSGNQFVEKSEVNVTDFYPHFVFSRVGFSNNGSQALVWFGDNRNPLGISAGFYLLEKEKGVWRVKSESEKLKS